MTLPKQFAGAEIFAKRRKRSEKWVVDQEQPQTPNIPATPRTPLYTEKNLVNHTTISYFHYRCKVTFCNHFFISEENDRKVKKLIFTSFKVLFHKGLRIY